MTWTDPLIYLVILKREMHKFAIKNEFEWSLATDGTIFTTSTAYGS